jgi:integrase/recombinase XerD
VERNRQQQRWRDQKRQQANLANNNMAHGKTLSFQVLSHSEWRLQLLANNIPLAWLLLVAYKPSMLSAFFDSHVRIKELRDSPAGHLIESFARALSEADYAKITVRQHLRAAEHFAYWFRQHGITLSEVDERVVARFATHLSQCECPHYGHVETEMTRGARLFVNHLREIKCIFTPVPKQSEDPELLSAFGYWMRQQRGTCDATVSQYNPFVRELLERIGEPRRLSASTLREFVLEKHRSCGWAKAKQCTTALRMFLRFLIAKGCCTTGLEAAVHTLAHWRLATLPRYLQPEEVERVIASCDPSSRVGRRDRAILLLLARLGLRAGDIVHLRLSDIDWKNASIQVCGKGRRQIRLPLTQEIGQAIVDYLQAARPRSGADTVFVRCRAPFHSLRSHCAVSGQGKEEEPGLVVDRGEHIWYNPNVLLH